MINRQRKVSDYTYQFAKDRLYRVAQSVLCGRFGVSTKPFAAHGVALIPASASTSDVGDAGWSARKIRQRPGEAARDASARTEIARVAIDASEELSHFLSVAREKSPDERYSYLYGAMTVFVAKFENLGLVEIAFELAKQRYPEDILGEILEMLGEIGNYRTLRYRRAIVEEALTARSPYLRFAAVSAADDLLLPSSSIKALLEREDVVELQQRAKSVLRALEDRATH